MFFPWFDRQQIRDGNYYEVHRTIKCYGGIWSIFALLAIVRLKDYFKMDGYAYTSDWYLTLNVYFQIS